MKILLVDDSMTMRTIQKHVLSGGFGAVDFVEAEDGQKALEIMAAHSDTFTLIIVDWNMPNMDGLAFVKRVRSADKKTPMLMCTTEAEKGRVMEALKAGVNNYALKPFTPEHLIDKVKQILAKAA